MKVLYIPLFKKKESCEICKRLILLAFIWLIFCRTIIASEVAVIVNSNFPELKNFAQQALSLLKSNNGFIGNPVLFELLGTSEDSKTLYNLKSLSPKMVLAIGAYSAKMARKVLPETPIIYTFVRYPEVEGFSQDPKMFGILMYGSENSLTRLILSFTNGRTDFASVKNIAVMYSEFLAPSITPLIEKLKEEGLNPQPYPLSEAPLLELIMQDIVSQHQALLLFPDKITQNDYSLRFVLTRCMEKRVLTFSLDYSLVEKGVSIGVYPKTEECLTLAVTAIKNFFLTGKLPSRNLLPPPRTYSIINKAALKYMGVPVSFIPDSEID